MRPDEINWPDLFDDTTVVACSEPLRSPRTRQEYKMISGELRFEVKENVKFDVLKKIRAKSHLFSSHK